MKIYYKLKIIYHKLMKSYHAEDHIVHGEIGGYEYMRHARLVEEYEIKLK